MDPTTAVTFLATFGAAYVVGSVALGRPVAAAAITASAATADSTVAVETSYFSRSVTWYAEKAAEKASALAKKKAADADVAAKEAAVKDAAAKEAAAVAAATRKALDAAREAEVAAAAQSLHHGGRRRF